MKNIILSISLLTAGAVHAQVEPAPLEEAQKAALTLNNAFGDPTDLPFSLATDLRKPYAIKAGQAAMLAVPVHALKENLKSATDGQLVPVGQLWLHKVVLEIDGEPAKNNDLRTVRIATPDGQDSATLYLLEIKKNGETGNLIVYGNRTTPLTQFPLRKMDVPQEAPIELDGKKRDDHSGELVLYIGDQFEARIIVRRPVPDSN
jgi:hypothetical protein